MLQWKYKHLVNMLCKEADWLITIRPMGKPQISGLDLSLLLKCTIPADLWVTSRSSGYQAICLFTGDGDHFIIDYCGYFNER